MKNQTLIGLAATTLVALATVPAWSGENVPSYAKQIVALQKQVSLLSALDDTKNRDILKLDFRIRDLERKVAGMQKQITKLHAKKADKWHPEQLTKEEKAYIEKNMGTDK